MVPGKFLGPLYLYGTQVLGIHKLAKIILGGEDQKFKFVAFQIVTPSFEDLY